ncbi:ferrichrome iron receptor [Rivularia sp. IAM M-261]|nr:ferrichrome iron receptor [Rivularia sp. IAM M-261]
MTVASFVLPNSVLAEIKTFDKDTPTGKQLNSSPNLAADTLFRVTGVKLNRKDNKIEVILETSAGQKLQPTSRTEGNTFIVDIPNSQLFLASGSKEFVTNKPLDGISTVTVTQVNNNTIQLRVTGEAELPQVELFDGNEGLIFAVAPANITQAPQPEAPQANEKPVTEALQDKPAAQQDDPIELVVTGEQDGYRAQEATTATRTNTPLRDIPQSIQVIPQQVIQDQQATRLVEVLKNAPGVVLGGRSPRDPLNIINIRGFDASNDILINGLPDPTSSEIAFGSNIERVEVLKGSASVLFGQGGLGGSVNLVTKQPLPTPFYSVEASAGSYNLYRGAIDLTGPLNESKTVLYRLNASAQTRESFIDFYGHRDYLVAPSLAFQLGDKTKLTLAAEYALSEGTYDFGLPPRGTVLPNPNGRIPRNRFVSEPDFNDTSNEVFRIGYDFEHRFSDDWQARSVFRTSLFRLRRDTVFPLALQNDGRTLNRGAEDGTEYNNNTYNLDNYIIGNFATGSIKHQIVAGFNLRRTDIDYKSNLSLNYAPLDIFNPVYRRTPTNPRFVPQANKDTVQQLGIYLQNQITLAENLKLLLGGRFDIANQNFQAPLTQTTDFKQTEAFSPRVGIVYQPIQPISLYASYSRSFNYLTSSGFAPAEAEPERGTQYEIGVKADITDRLAATLAFYDLTRSNLPTSDPDNPFQSILVGKQRSRGIEFDISGEILRGWNVIAGYAFTNAEITEDNDLPIGNQLNNVPKHALNLWTTYELQSGSLKGLGFGLGVFYYGDRQGELGNTFELPGYTRTDAAIFYKRDNFRASLNIRNLFDVDYFVSAQNRNRVLPGDPLTVQGTISWQF